MVQRPHLNLLHSSITCAVAAGGLLWLIPRFGAMAQLSAFFCPISSKASYVTQRCDGCFTGKIRGAIFATTGCRGIAFVPALVCRVFLGGIVGQITSAAAFLAVFGVQWWRHHTRSKHQHA